MTQHDGTGACMHRGPPVHTCPCRRTHGMHSSHTHSVLRTESAQGRPGQCCRHAIAARAQPAARLLDKLRTLLLQRRGRALLGRRLRLGARLGACLVYLSNVAFSCHQEGMVSHCRSIPQLHSTSSPPPYAPCCHTQSMYSRPVHSLRHTLPAESGEGSAVSWRMGIRSCAHASQSRR